MHQQAIDTKTAAGPATFGMVGVFAEFERSMIQERIRAGIARARSSPAPGAKPFGCPANITPEQARDAIQSATRAVRMRNSSKR